MAFAFIVHFGSRVHSIKIIRRVGLLLLVMVSAMSAAQSTGSAPAVDELQARIQAAAVARDSHNPEEVARADSRVQALALRRLGNIRVAQTAFAQAAELYRRSLAWEDAAETHVGLAICELYENRPDDSLAEAAKALQLDPKSARAFNIQGKAWMKKRDYRKAADSLQRSVDLHPEFEAAYALGVSLLSLHDAASKQQAAKVFDTIVASVGDSGSLRVLFGRAYRDAEMQDDSIRELRRAVALDTHTPHAHYFLGLSLLWKNEWTDTPEILQEFATELQNYPRDFLANYFLGFWTPTTVAMTKPGFISKVRRKLIPHGRSRGFSWGWTPTLRGIWPAPKNTCASASN